MVVRFCLTTKIRSLSASNNHYHIQNPELTLLSVQKWVYILIIFCYRILIFSSRMPHLDTMGRKNWGFPDAIQTKPCGLMGHPGGQSRRKGKVLGHIGSHHVTYWW